MRLDNMSFAYVMITETAHYAKIENGGNIKPNKNDLYPYVLQCRGGSMPVRRRTDGSLGTTFFLDATVARQNFNDEAGNCVIEPGKLYFVTFQQSEKESTYTSNGNQITAKNWEVVGLEKVSTLEMLKGIKEVGKPNRFVGASAINPEENNEEVPATTSELEGGDDAAF